MEKLHAKLKMSPRGAMEKLPVKLKLSPLRSYGEASYEAKIELSVEL